ncbi:KGGVGR-motif variant AAA ATPase [Falsiroseomonas ponticola]|uniref:KGGVGR-motif variant AAA ATPase n=1 Tax=Falsiroseomonas ponticola TaxID=2786951 RepID=UPI001931D39D|nr:AAA family ATPase [Roseomonas ponticola]
MTSYDSALPNLVEIMAASVGSDILSDCVFLRDASGRISIVCFQRIREDAAKIISERAKGLGVWVGAETPLIYPEDLLEDSAVLRRDALPEFVSTASFEGFVRLLERRVVGQDWLRPPLTEIPGAPPIVVFASHKGGVGRSTALAVSAASLSDAGFNVLVIDLDLEAPGLGYMLLDALPPNGALDYFVETSVRNVSEPDIDLMLASSTLATQGLIHVVPAVGTTSAMHPENVLGKIARAYLERQDPDGTTVSFLDRVRQLVRHLSQKNRYDIIFVDARAGLNEAAAAAVLGLGAEILLFGVDTPQTFAGYKYLLAHLRRFKPAESTDQDWRYRLRMVHSKALSSPDSQKKFRDAAFEMFADTVYDVDENLDQSAFSFDYDSVDAPHYAWVILNDSNYAEFDPLSQRDQFASHFYDRTFGGFVRALRDRVGLVS